jgi:hypothetical protein
MTYSGAMPNFMFLMFVLTLANGLCCASYLVLVQVSREGIRSINWAPLSRFHLKMEADSSIQKGVSLTKNRTMDNVQEYNYYTIVINL